MENKKSETSWWRFYQYFGIYDVIGAVLVLVFSFWGYWLVQQQPHPEGFDWASVVFGLVPTIPLLALWFIERKKRWIEKLPTYMTVKLNNHKQQKIGQVDFVPIQNNSDLRSQAQTVLRTLNHGQNLNLELFIRHENIESQVMKNPLKEGYCELKTVTINLVEPVDKDTPSIQNLSKGKYLQWCPLQNETKPSLKELSTEENA